MRNLKDILTDYQINNDIFNEEEEITTQLKEIIWNNEIIDEVDRRIILMYADLGSLRKLGKELSVSGSAIHQRIKQIRKKIYDNLDRPTTDNVNSGLCDRPLRDNRPLEEMDTQEIH